MRTFADFAVAIENAKIMLNGYGRDVDTGSWQGVPTEGRPDMVKVEYLNWQAAIPVYRPGPDPWLTLQQEIKPNLPWADDHFEERVSRVPSNPGEQYKNWPWWNPWTGEKAFAETNDPHGLFTHTYQERFWPKYAGVNERGRGANGMRGIRYDYGDLDDVVNLLYREPHTNQAYLPIFFPEDTGAVHGGRVPCTLGYHFMLRDYNLHMWYDIRACDYVRHLRDDIYLAVRLQMWMIEQLFEMELRERGTKEQLWVDVNPGYLYFTAHSLHYHKGDAHHVH